MTRPNIVDYWSALRSGDPDAVAALDHARSITVDVDELQARALRAEIRSDHLAAVIDAALGALRSGNSAAAVHVLSHAHDPMKVPA